MSDTVETAPPAVRRDRLEARRAARQAKASRERRIVECLNRGVSVAEIAEREDVGEKRMRALVRDILARRMPQPPAQFIATQVNRLEEALRVSFDAMSGANLQAVDRVVKIVRELDRYHGFAAAERWGLPDAPRSARGSRPRGHGAACRPDSANDARGDRARKCHGPGNPGPRDLAPSATAPVASALDPAEAPPISPQMAPQRLEKIESGPGNGMAPEASGPTRYGRRDGVFASASTRPAKLRIAVETPPVRPQMAPQRLEKIESAPGNGMAPEAPDPQDMVHGATALASALDPAGRTPLAVEAPPTSPEMAPQKLEKMESAPGNGIAPEGSSPEDLAPACEPLVSPTAANPSGARRVNLRMMLNGVAAC